MSSTTYDRALTFIVVASVASLGAIGCGRSPAMPRTPAKVLRVEGARVETVPVDCEADDEAEDVAPRRSVEYVPMSEWRAPESAKRAEASVERRAASGPRGPSGYMSFPQLTLHRPIPATTWAGRYRWR